MSISNCDEERLRISNMAKAQFDEGRQLVSKKEFEKALECYLFAFDNSHYVDGWAGVRLSFIPSEIALIGKHYPKALEALRARRDARETLILEGETDYGVCSEWNSLNRYLGETMREFEVLEKLKASGKLDPKLEKLVTQFNFEFLLENRQYELLRGEFKSRGSFFLHSIVEFETLSLFPTYRNPKPGLNWIEMERLRLMDIGITLFHLALGLKKDSIADLVMKRILEICDKSAAYEKLIRVAITTDNITKAQEIYDQGTSSLSSEQRAVLSELIVERGYADRPNEPADG